MSFLHSDLFLIIIFILNIVLLIGSIISNIRIRNIHNKDKIFMEKLGDGKNIKEDLDNYMRRVSGSEEEIRKLSLYFLIYDFPVTILWESISQVKIPTRCLYLPATTGTPALPYLPGFSLHFHFSWLLPV